MGSDRPLDKSSEQQYDWDHRSTSWSNWTLGLIIFGIIVLWFVVGVFYGYIVNQ